MINENEAKVGENIAKAGYQTVNPGTGGTGQPLDFDAMKKSQEEGPAAGAAMRERLGLEPVAGASDLTNANETTKTEKSEESKSTRKGNSN